MRFVLYLILDIQDSYLKLEMYNPEPKSKLRNPILYQHHGQPPTYILVCGLDPIRDEGIIYNQALSDTGVKTRMDIFAGLPHGFWSTFPEANFAKDYREKSVDGLRWLLHQVGSQ
jgi:acetyl esterase/lipase